jgi:hypothetical protein
MKKWLSLAIVILILAGIAIWRFAFRPTSSPPLSAFVPERAAIYLSADDLAGFWDRFVTGEFWRELSGSPLWKKAGIPEKIASWAAGFEAAAGFPLDRDNFRELCGRQIALALLPEEKGRPACFLLATRVGAKTRALELVSRWRDKIRAEDQRSLRESERSDLPWVEIRPSEVFPFSSAYAFFGDCLVFLVSPVRAGREIEEVLSLAQGKGTGASIAALDGFRETSGLLPPSFSPRLFWHLRADRLSALWGGGGLVGIEAPGMREWETLSNNLRSRLETTRSLGGAVWLERGLKGFIRREFDVARAKEIYGEKLSRPISRRLDGLRFAPASALGVWAAAEDFSLCWERARIDWEMLAPLLTTGADRDSREVWTALFRTFREDLLPALSDEAAVVLNRLASPGLIPLPDAALAVKVKDAAAAARGMEKVVAAAIGSRPILPSSARRGKWEITTVPVAPFFQPAWAAAEGYLVAGTASAAVEKALLLLSGGEGRLIDEADFRRLAEVIPAEGGRYLYLDTARLSDDIAEVIRWAAAFAPKEERQREFLSAPEAIESLRPWKRLEKLALRARAQQNVVIDDFYWYSAEESFSGAASGTPPAR